MRYLSKKNQDYSYLQKNKMKNKIRGVTLILSVKLDYQAFA